MADHEACTNGSPVDDTTPPAMSSNTEQLRSLKVPIPRLQRHTKSNEENGTSPASADKHRVSHACEPCRQRKTKCSGERPICKHCGDFKIICFYAGGKRDRAKTEMATLKTKVDMYEQLLGQLKGQVDSAGKLAISKALQGAYPAVHGSKLVTETEKRDGESLVSADLGSTGSMDHIREDVNSDNHPYPAGYMGKSSEIAWIQQVAQQLAKEAHHKSPSLLDEDDETYQFQTAAYHLDDLSISVPGGPDVDVDPFLLPERQTADQLVQDFFSTVHSAFPIIIKELFMNQYDMFFQNPSSPAASNRWLAMLNLIFAIGSLYGKLLGASWKGDDSEHLKYFARARALGLDDGSLFEAADMQQVQVVGLTGMYLLASNQTNRAWNIIGLAIRYAQTLGLNLRNAVPEFDEVERELRARVWFALFAVEHLLCLITGRPSAVQDRDCSVPLPRPVDESSHGMANFEAALRQSAAAVSTSTSSPSFSTMGIHSILTPMSSNPSTHTGTPGSQFSVGSRGPSVERSAKRLPPRSSSVMQILGQSPQASNIPSTHKPSGLPNTENSAAYFLEHIKLTKITCAVISSLYSPCTVNRSWSDVQGVISLFELELVKWKAQVPSFLNFTDSQPTSRFNRERLSLAFQYNHARILINRPCLSRLGSQIPNESNRSRSFNRSAAATCVSAAREIVACLQDDYNVVGLISVSPWWCLLHYIVAAGVILMAEISVRADHNPQQADGLLRDIKKVVKWLRAMAKENMAAERSWAVLNKLLIVSAPKIGADVSDVERDLEPRELPKNARHSPNALNLTPLAAPEGMPYNIFRGHSTDDTFRLSGSSRHPLNNLLASVSNPISLLSPHAQTAPSTPLYQDNIFPVGLKHPPLLPLPPTSMGVNPQVSSPPLDRHKKRHSLGVSRVSMLPPPQFAQWSSPESSIGFAAESAQHGKADLAAAVSKVRDDLASTGHEPLTSKKRASDSS